MQSRNYTDDQIERMKNGEAMIKAQFDAFKIQVMSDVRENGRYIKENGERIDNLNLNLCD